MVPWSWFLENDFKKYVTRIINTSKKTKWKKNRRKNK